MAKFNPLKSSKSSLVSEQSTIKTFKEGEINYIDAGSLHRPLTLPKKFYPILLGLCVIALIIAAILGFRVNDSVVHYDDKQQAKVEEAIKRDIDQQIPAMSSIVVHDDETIKANLSEAGIQYADMNEINGASEYSLDVLTIPSDMTIEEVDPALTGGINKLDTVTGSKFLSGSWRLLVTRGDENSFRLRYADFNATDPNIAIQSAMEVQGLTEDNVDEEGTDTSGNVFKSGKISIDGADYQWTISACSLTSVYSIPGLPSTAQYVGVRYTH